MNTFDITSPAPPLRFTQATAVWENLKVLKRTGWVQWNIPRPETVYEHTLAVRDLALKYKNELGLSKAELDDLLDVLEVHDWPEAFVGDGVILGDEEDVDSLRENKQTKELSAMQQICHDVEDGERILALYQRYASGADDIARLAKQIEKLQAVYKAQEYEAQYQKKGLLAEFVYYTKDLIHHQFLQSEFKQLAATVSFWLLYISVPAGHYSSLMQNAFTTVLAAAVFKKIVPF